ncbi:MAG: ABC transporter ATP-binding protein [Thiohalomonadales bacterium]|nr:ABC transporter ATP-binding protein [Thiohalomonadales bacterium]
MLLRADHLHYAYEEAGHLHDVLQDVSLGLDTGERVALLGSSGSGKSTLLNLLGGIDAPTDGLIQIADKTITHMKEPDLTLFRRRHIGFIYQQFNLIPTLTTAENILLPLELLGLPLQEQQQKLTHWLDAIGLSGREQSFPDQLSGGEQQRVSIARALIHQPTLVLADEPTGNLDAQTGQRVLNLLFELASEYEQTLLVVTHSKAVADKADRILILEQGMLHNEGPQEIAW